MNWQQTDHKAIWLRFRIWDSDRPTVDEYVWVDLRELVAIHEQRYEESYISRLVMRNNHNWLVHGWAGERLKELQVQVS